MVAAAANLPFFRRFRPLAYTLVLLAIAGIAYAESSPLFFFLAALGVLISWWLVERPGGAPLPRALINLGVLAASLGLFYELVPNRDPYIGGRPNLLLALGHFMVAIMLCKLFERKSNRDYAQILTLTLLVMVAGAIVATSSLFFAVLLATYLGLGLYAILLFHLRAETERAMNANPLAFQSTLHAEASPRIRKDIRLIAGWSGFLLLAISTIVFLLFPRSSGQDLFSSITGASSTTGYADYVRLEPYVHLHESDAVVMEVKIEQDGVNLGSESVQPYFRGMVLGTYDTGGRKWIRSMPGTDDMDVDYPIGSDHPVQLLAPDKYSKLGIITQTYTIESPSANAIFAMAPPATFASDQLHGISYSPRDMILSTRGAVPKHFHYTVESPVIVDQAAYGDTKLAVKPDDLGSYMIFDNTGDHVINSKGVPAAVAKLARSLIKDFLPPNGGPPAPAVIRQIAARFNDYLRNNYPYSLNFRAVDASIDPTEDFLINRKRTGGNCEFFASAMVMMCRAVGINARMATGYHGGDYNSIGGFYVVKQKYAHAWAEVFLPRRGWTVYDPSPASTDTPADSIVHWFQEMGQVLQKVWLTTVVAFDNTSRKYLFTVVSSLVAGAVAHVKTFFGDITFGFRDLFLSSSSPWWLRALGFGSLAWVLYLMLWLAQNWNRRRTSQIPRILRSLDRKSQRQLAQDLLFFDELLRLLGRSGAKKLAEDTPREYVDKVSSSLGHAGDDARWLIGTFYAIRFGTLRVTSGLRQQIDAALNHVRRELQHPAA